jgi:hypothetical protein
LSIFECLGFQILREKPPKKEHLEKIRKNTKMMYNGSSAQCVQKKPSPNPPKNDSLAGTTAAMKFPTLHESPGDLRRSLIAFYLEKAVRPAER